MTEENTQEAAPDELQLLKNRADQMGLKYHPSIGIDKLRDKVNLALKQQDAPIPEAEKPIPDNVAPLVKTQAQKNSEMRREAGRLIRVRVNCMNPNKKDYEGEIFTVSNSVVGTFKKYVPYNNEEGWHIPKMIYDHLIERECQIFYTTNGPRGEKIRKGKLIKEFAIEVLDPLTGEELQKLAQRQAMANNLD